MQQLKNTDLFANKQEEENKKKKKHKTYHATNNLILFDIIQPCIIMYNNIKKYIVTSNNI